MVSKNQHVCTRKDAVKTELNNSTGVGSNELCPIMRLATRLFKIRAVIWINKKIDVVVTTKYLRLAETFPLHTSQFASLFSVKYNVWQLCDSDLISYQTFILSVRFITLRHKYPVCYHPAAHLSLREIIWRFDCLISSFILLRMDNGGRHIGSSQIKGSHPTHRAENGKIYYKTNWYVYSITGNTPAK